MTVIFYVFNVSSAVKCCQPRSDYVLSCVTMVTAINAPKVFIGHGVRFHGDDCEDSNADMEKQMVN